MNETTDLPRVLIVDDDPDFARLTLRVLERQGMDCSLATNPAEAMDVLESRPFDLVVCDLFLPNAEGEVLEVGLELLQAMRDVRPDVGFVVVTASPRVDTAIGAMDLDVSAYVPKPMHPEMLVSAVHRAYERCSDERRIVATAATRMEARVRSEVAFRQRHLDAALAELRMAYQPILDRRGRLVAHEALMRPATFQSPPEVLGLAAQLGRGTEVTRAVFARVASDLPDRPGDVYVNVLPADLEELGLIEKSPLAPFAPRVVLEVTEAGSIRDVERLQGRLALLRAMGFRIALDDLGAGFSALSRLAQLEPDVVKLDRSLIDRLDESPRLQRIVRTLVELCSIEGALVVAEGIETRAVHRTVLRLGCHLMQGYLLGRPALPEPMPIVAAS